MDLDGDLAGDVVRTGLGRPFLFLGDRNAVAKEPYLKGMVRGVLQGVPPGQGQLLTITGAGHENFTDRGVYFNLLGRRLGFLGGIDGARALGITGACIRAFFDTYQRGVPSPLKRYPEVRAEAL